MWIFTKDGFFSIVQNKKDPAQLMVRARVREDIADAFGGDDILESEGSDYRFRKSLPRAVIAEYLSNESFELDYESVKDEIDKDDDRRHKMLYEIWRAHWNFQRDTYGNDSGDWFDLDWRPSDESEFILSPLDRLLGRDPVTLRYGK